MRMKQLGRYIKFRDRRFQLIAIGMVIVAVSVVAVGRLSGGYDMDNHEVLAGTMDMNWGFTVSPVKALVTMGDRPALVPIRIENKTDTVKSFEVRQEEAWKLTEGLQHWDGSMKLRFPQAITVKAHSVFAFDVVIDKGKAASGQEVWLMITQVSDNAIEHEVAVRLLIELDTEGG